MSTAEAALHEKARAVPPGSLRHTVLLSAKRFKSTWVELGKLLVKVRNEASYEGWGFESFEAYCSKELHIRKATADKLTRSFSFLAKHEPAAIESDDAAQVAPAFEVVEVLAGAEERGQLTAKEYRSIRDSIWDSEKTTPELKRELSERYPRPAPEPPGEAVALRRLASFARKLAAELSGSRQVPKGIVDRAVALAEDVEELAASRTREQ